MQRKKLPGMKSGRNQVQISMSPLPLESYSLGLFSPGTSCDKIWIIIYQKFLVTQSDLLVILVWLFATPWTVAHQAPLSMEFSRQQYWSGLLYPSPEDCPDPGIKTRSPTLQADSLPSEPPGKQGSSIKIQSPRFSLGAAHVARFLLGPTKIPDSQRKAGVQCKQVSLHKHLGHRDEMNSCQYWDVRIPLTVAKDQPYKQTFLSREDSGCHTFLWWYLSFASFSDVCIF